MTRGHLKLQTSKFLHLLLFGLILLSPTVRPSLAAATTPPSISTISPTSGSTDGGNTVTIDGTDLQFATSVTFGGTAATFGYNSMTGKLQPVAPAHAAGAVNVSVTTPGGTATKTNGYTYVTTVTTGNLAVTVKRSDTSALLSGATVTLSGGPSTPSQTTGGDGTTTFSNLAVGNYIVTASLAEYQTNNAPATVIANTPPVSISLTPSQELTPPPQQPKPPVDPPVTLTLEGKAVVITHGWNSDASSWVKEMAEAICKELGLADPPTWSVKENDSAIVCQVNGWDVWVYDWRLNAEAWLGWEFVGGGIRLPSYAKSNAGLLGSKLAIALNKGAYQHIHFIAHSAGANLIEEASRWMRVYRPTRTIHETFLDAYDDAGEVSSYGHWANWADNYVDTRNTSPLGIGDGTKLFLKEAYNIDVTPRGIDARIIQNQDCGSLLILWEFSVCRHDRPFRFYGESISGDGYLGDGIGKAYDPINGTAGKGYPLSVENRYTLDSYPRTDDNPAPGTLNHILQLNTQCIMQDGICYPDALPPGMWSTQILVPSYVEVTQQVATFYVESVKGATNSLYSSIKMGWSLATGLVPQQTLAVRESATSGTATDYLIVDVTTTTPANTLRFNWSFAVGGEGLLRVFVGGNLVREIDQRYVTPSSPETEEIYIGSVEGPLPPGTHRITFRLDGFGASANGVELTDVDLGLRAAVSPTLTVTKAGTGTGTVTSAPAGIDCGADCSESYASGTPVSLTAIPDPLSIFVGWGGNCAADGTVTLDAAKTCTATFTATVIGPLTISTTSPPAGEQGAAYGYALLAEGGTPPYTWSLGGGKKNKLPQGLTLTSDGILTGVPTKAKTATFTVQVTDATYALATKNLSLQIVKSVKIKTKKLRGGTVGIPYSSTLKTKGGIAPLAFSVVGGALPPGLTLDPGTGQVSGTPAAAGAFDFVAQVTSSGGSSHQKNIRIKMK
jgi:hypothetical protein